MRRPGTKYTDEHKALMLDMFEKMEGPAIHRCKKIARLMRGNADVIWKFIRAMRQEA